MRFARLVIVGILLSANTHAAGFDTKTLLEALHSLNSHTKTLNTLAAGIVSLDEKNLAYSMLEASDDINSELGFLVDLGHLSTDMVNPQDKDKVRKLILAHVLEFEQACSNDINFITKLLALTQSPALASEGEHFRDELTKSCELVKTWK